MLASFEKNPQANLDYSIDWTLWLNDDSLESSAWSVPPGLTKGIETNTERIATVWLNGGIVDRTYEVTNTIMTVAGRQDHRSIQITIKNV